MKQKHKKAMGELKTYFAVFLGVIVVAYVFFVLTDSLTDTLRPGACTDDGGYWNSATETCQVSSSNTTAVAYSSVGLNASSNIETGMFNATDQLPQAGTLIGIGVILGVIGLAVWGARRYGLF